MQGVVCLLGCHGIEMQDDPRDYVLAVTGNNLALIRLSTKNYVPTFEKIVLCGCEGSGSKIYIRDKSTL